MNKFITKKEAQNLVDIFNGPKEYKYNNISITEPKLLHELINANIEFGDMSNKKWDLKKLCDNGQGLIERIQDNIKAYQAMLKDVKKQHNKDLIEWEKM